MKHFSFRSALPAKVRRYSGVLFVAGAALSSLPSSLPFGSPAHAQSARSSDSSGPILVNINGRVIQADPAPILSNGSILVPLRGVLESLGAKIGFDAAENRIDIEQGEKKVSLRIGSSNAIVDLKAVRLSAAPRTIGNRTFVPLRALAELFGYSVTWLPRERTVSVVSQIGARTFADHRAALKAGGHFGVEVDFSDVSNQEADALLDAAKRAGATIIKTRFDWNTLEPEKGAAFAWPIYNHIVRAARERDLILVGVLGNSARWASIYTRTEDPNLWRNGPPREAEMKSWANYARRTVGRYANDVHAWQIWGGTSQEQFRSGFRVYLQVFNTAAKAARESDPKAIIQSAEPGGVDLDAVENLQTYVTPQLLNGISLYPKSGFQSGVPAPPEAFLRPLATLRTRPAARNRDLWIGGLAFPVVETTADGTVFGLNQADADVTARLLRTYTPAAQADYLARAMTLGFASGSDKVFWSNLRDGLDLEPVQPVNAAFGAGLLRRDLTPRPSFAAFQTLTKLIGDKPFIGALALGPGAIALVFDNGREGSAIAWGLNNATTLTFNAEGTDPQVPDSVFIGTRADSQLLDSAGNVVGGAAGALKLGARPVWISKIAADVAARVKALPNAKRVALAERTPDWDAATGVSATLGENGEERGVFWRPYQSFRSEAQKTVTLDGRSGLLTEISTDIFKPAAGRFFVHLDVADEFLFFQRATPVEVLVTVHRVAPDGNTSPFAPVGGFNLQYNSPSGRRNTTWQVVETGQGWITYKFTIPDASFANTGGFDFLINTFGSKKNLVFSAVTVQKIS